MQKYIESEVLLKSDNWQRLESDFDKARAHIIILGQPAADVVEVVRCKDCRLRETIECFADDIHSVRDNDFCSWGEYGAKMDGERGKDR